MAVTTADQNKVDTTFDNENNGDETVGAVGVVGDGSASQTLDGNATAANGAAGVAGTGRPMTEEEMIAEAIRRGEETAEAEIAADAQRAAQERDRLQNELDSVSDQIEAAKQQAAEAKTALDGSDIEAIKKAGEKLTEVGQKLAEIVYADAQAQTAGNNGAASNPSEPDVVDADYEVVDDDKNQN